jgi:hypothetical protein
MAHWLQREPHGRAFWFTVGAAFCLAFVLRVWGIDHGLPYGQLPDESGDIATSLRIVRGDLPEYAYHRVGWPVAQLPLHAAHFIGLRLTHPNFDLAAFEAHYFTERDDFVLLTRLWLAFLVSLAVFPLGITARWLGLKLGGVLLVGVLYATQPALAYLGHVALPDSFAVLWIAVGLWAAVGIARFGTRRWYVLAGAALALAMLARLQTVMLVVPIALGHVWFVGHQPHRVRLFLVRPFWSIGAFFVVSIVFNPFIVLTPQRVIADIAFIYSERYAGTYNQAGETQTAANSFNNISANLSLPVIFMRPWLALVAGIAILWALGQRQAWVGIIAAFWVIFTIYLLPTPTPRITFWLPALVPLVMLAAWGVSQLRGRRASVLALLLVGANLWETVQINHLLSQPDTRTLAYDYITTNIPPDTPILMGDPFVYSVPLARNIASIKRMATLQTLPPVYAYFLNQPAAAPSPQYDLYGVEYQAHMRNADELQAFVQTYAIEYVIVADFCQGGLQYSSNSDMDFPPIPSTAAVTHAWELVAVFSPFGVAECQQPIENRTHLEYLRLGAWQRVGAIIRVYRVQSTD